MPASQGIQSQQLYFHKLTSKAFICSFSGKNLLALEQSSDNVLQKHAAHPKAFYFVKELF